jgi:uncharacterized membrane protein YraQ (UPF0718 family)
MSRPKEANQQSRWKRAGRGLLNNIKMSVPILVGILLLIGLINTLVPKEFFSRIFTGNRALDPLIGALFGSIAAGSPLTSYVIGGELLKSGISLVAVLAFIVSWVTVGTVQLPAESMMLGKRFALTRNAICLVFAIVVAVLTVLISGIFG